MALRTHNPKPKKLEFVEAFREEFEKSKLILLTDYKGMSVKQLTELRKKLRKDKASLKIFKNTYAVKALSGEYASVADKFKGSVAMIFGYEDVVSPAKTLVSFIGENEKPGIICGIVDRNVFSVSQVEKLAKLPSKQELLSKVVGSMKSPLYNIVSVMQGPIRKLVYVLEAVKNSKGS